MTTDSAQTIARERQLDWLLDEVLGDGEVRRAPSHSFSWVAAALALFAIGVAFGVAWLRDEPAPHTAQDPPAEPAWHECHGPDALDAVPADVVALRCFDFDDTACGRLAKLAAKFTQLEHLDLSGMDVDERGVSRPIRITDAGVHRLGAFTGLRWLSLATCPDLKGTGLEALEAMPRLEHLDLTYSGVESPGVERLQRLPSLRTLVLSYCLNFHGDSLRAIAKLPGLRRLELRGCATIAAKDALHLVQLHELRHLDLRDCQGRYRGQRIAIEEMGLFKDTDGDGLPDARVVAPQPVEDGVGITDKVFAALAVLPLETLRLGGSESLTDAIGESLARIESLRALDLSNLPKTSGAVFARVPAGIEELWLGDNEQWRDDDLARLPALPRLRTFGMSGLQVDAPRLRQMLAGKRLRSLAIGGQQPRSKGDPRATVEPTTAVIEALDALAELETLDLGGARLVDQRVTEAIAKLPKLRTLDLTAPLTNPLLDRGAAIAALAPNRSIVDLRLVWNRLTAADLAALHALPLRSLDVRGTTLTDEEVRTAAKAWPGCRVTLPNGTVHQVR